MEIGERNHFHTKSFSINYKSPPCLRQMQIFLLQIYRASGPLCPSILGEGDTDNFLRKPGESPCVFLWLYISGPQVTSETISVLPHFFHLFHSDQLPCPSTVLLISMFLWPFLRHPLLCFAVASLCFRNSLDRIHPTKFHWCLFYPLLFLGNPIFPLNCWYFR